MKTKMKFKIEVNPFKKKVIINTKIGNTSYTFIKYYCEIDEWDSFEIASKIFDIHYCYDKKFTVSIYKVEDDRANYKKQYDTELSFRLTD